MEHIAEKALTFRSPAVVNGELSYLKLEQYRGQWVAVSFVPCLGPIEAELLDRYSTDVELLGVTLLLVSTDPMVLRQEPAGNVVNLRFPLVGDPLGRIQRLFGGSTTRTWGRARTFLIDPDGHFRFHLMELLRSYQGEEVRA